MLQFVPVGMGINSLGVRMQYYPAKLSSVPHFSVVLDLVGRCSTVSVEIAIPTAEFW